MSCLFPGSRSCANGDRLANPSSSVSESSDKFESPKARRMMTSDLDLDLCSFFTLKSKPRSFNIARTFLRNCGSPGTRIEASFICVGVSCFAPLASSKATVSSWPHSSASLKAPLSSALMSAPAFNRISVMLVWPDLAATRSGMSQRLRRLTSAPLAMRSFTIFS